MNAGRELVEVQQIAVFSGRAALPALSGMKFLTQENTAGASQHCEHNQFYIF